MSGGLSVITLPHKELTMEGADFENPRVHIERKPIGELAESIREHGLLYSLCVWKTKDEAGKPLNVVVDGGRRLRAIELLVKQRKAGDLKDKVPVRIVIAKTLQDARIAALVGNIQRVELTSYETALAMQNLKDEGMEQKAIAAKLNKSATWVSRQLSALKNSTDAVKQAWKQAKISDDSVQDLAKLPEPEQTRRLTKMLEELGNNKSSNGAATRQAKAKARKTAKNGNGDARPVRPGADKLGRYVEICSKAKRSNRYVRGMHDAFKFMTGELGPGEFDKESEKRRLGGTLTGAEGAGFHAPTVGRPPRLELARAFCTLGGRHGNETKK